MTRLVLHLAPLALLVLAACQSNTTVGTASQTAPPRYGQSGLDRVMGKTADDLTRLFGPFELDVRDGPARKLQFASSVCVLDAFFYPPENGGEPTVRHVDSRLPTGADFDSASCIAALTRRPAAR